MQSNLAEKIRKCSLTDLLAAFDESDELMRSREGYLRLMRVLCRKFGEGCSKRSRWVAILDLLERMERDDRFELRRRHNPAAAEYCRSGGVVSGGLFSESFREE